MYSLEIYLYGRCSRERKLYTFEIVPKIVATSFHENIHKNSCAKLFATNHQLAAAIQQMGCKPSDDITLVDFFGSGTHQKNNDFLKKVKKFGLIQEKLHVTSKMEAVQVGAMEAKKNNGFQMYGFLQKVINVDHCLN